MLSFVTRLVQSTILFVLNIYRSFSVACRTQPDGQRVLAWRRRSLQRKCPSIVQLSTRCSWPESTGSTAYQLHIAAYPSYHIISESYQHMHCPVAVL